MLLKAVAYEVFRIPRVPHYILNVLCWTEKTSWEVSSHISIICRVKKIKYLLYKANDYCVQLLMLVVGLRGIKGLRR